MFSSDACGLEVRTTDGLEWNGRVTVNMVWVPTDEVMDEAGRIAEVAVKDCFPGPLCDHVDLGWVASDSARGSSVCGVGVKFECSEEFGVFVVEYGAENEVRSFLVGECALKPLILEVLLALGGCLVSLLIVAGETGESGDGSWVVNVDVAQTLVYVMLVGVACVCVCWSSECKVSRLSLLCIRLNVCL